MYTTLTFYPKCKIQESTLLHNHKNFASKICIKLLHEINFILLVNIFTVQRIIKGKMYFLF